MMKYFLSALTLLLAFQLSAADMSPAVEAAGASAAMELKKNLMGALRSALGKGDIAGAIKICSAQAMPLTTESAQVDPAVLSIHRRTDKWRNPANQADRLDKIAMQRFQKNKALSEWTISESGEVTRYYQPLRILPMCLTCHGDPDTFADEVKEALGAHYAKDRATGYKEGELRGVIQVRVQMLTPEQCSVVPWLADPPGSGRWPAFSVKPTPLSFWMVRRWQPALRRL